MKNQKVKVRKAARIETESAFNHNEVSHVVVETPKTHEKNVFSWEFKKGADTLVQGEHGPMSLDGDIFSKINLSTDVFQDVGQDLVKIVQDQLVSSTPEQFNETCRRTREIFKLFEEGTACFGKCLKEAIDAINVCDEAKLRHRVRMERVEVDLRVELGLVDDEDGAIKH